MTRGDVCGAALLWGEVTERGTEASSSIPHSKATWPESVEILGATGCHPYTQLVDGPWAPPCFGHEAELRRCWGALPEGLFRTETRRPGDPA